MTRRPICQQCMHKSKGGIWVPARRQLSMSSYQDDHLCGYEFRPDDIYGCEAFYCTNIREFGAGAVGFPVDPLVDGNMEAAGVGAWSKFPADGTLSKDGTPHSGTQCLKLLCGATANVEAYQNGILVIGNTYRVQGVAESDGAARPRVVIGGTLRWTGTTDPGWQAFDLEYAANVATSIEFTSISTVGQYVRFDDITVTPLNSSQFTDLSGNARHLVQATAANQPLWVASGSGGYLSTDGTADMMSAAFAFNQPNTIVVLMYSTSAAAAQVQVGDSAGAASYVYTSASDGLMKLFNTGAQISYAFTNGWNVVTAISNGANSEIAINNNAPATGNSGANNWGGICFGTNGVGTNPATMRMAALAAYSRALSASEYARVIRWMLRQKAMLAL